MATSNGSIPSTISQSTFGSQAKAPHKNETQEPSWRRAAVDRSLHADMTFDQAADLWMQARGVSVQDGARANLYLRHTTAHSYRQYVGSLKLFFGGMRLGDIRPEHIARYQAARIEGAEPFIRKRRPQDKDAVPCPCQPKKVNQELGLLKNLLVRARCWTDGLDEQYQPLLDDNDDVQRALDPEQQTAWLDVARKSARWDVVYCYSLLAFNTCMSTNEIRGLRLGDVNLDQRILSVARKTAKNKYRARTIELVGADLLWALGQLIDRARSLGAVAPQHYLFPTRVSLGTWNPEAPMSESGIKKQWQEVRIASKLTWFRQYDCRHTAITRLAESGVPVDVIMSRAGHVSEKMRRHYTHISQSSQRKWLEHANSYHRVGVGSARLDNPWSASLQPETRWAAGSQSQAIVSQDSNELIRQLFREIQELRESRKAETEETHVYRELPKATAAAGSNLIAFRQR